MQVIYYGAQSRFMCPMNFLPMVTYDWRDDVGSFVFTGPTWCQWFIPGTITD